MISHKKIEIYLLLHNIRSTHNVGSILRTADAVGVKHVYISGYTPAPIDRFGRSRSDISKVSLGAENSVKWSVVDNVIIKIKELKSNKFCVVGLEQNEKSINYKKFNTKGKILLIVGNEVGGIEKEILNLCNEIIEIPMYGSKESLNVSVATGIALYSII
jgi:tRNA G18 (ribose-2'-O)-methylase SpoU